MMEILPDIDTSDMDAEMFDEKGHLSEHWREGNKWGVDELALIKKIKKYIMVGNLYTHCHKPILELPHEEFSFPWLWSRSSLHDQNRIFVWHHEE